MRPFFPLAFAVLITTACAKDEITFNTPCDIGVESYSLVDTANVWKPDTLPYSLTITEPNFIEAKINGVVRTFDYRGTEAESDYNRCFNRGNGPVCFLDMFNSETQISATIYFGSLETDSIHAPLVIDASSNFSGTFVTRYVDDNFDTLRVEGNTTDGLKLTIDHYTGNVISGTFSGTAYSTLNSVNEGEVEIEEGSFFLDLAENNYNREDRYLVSPADEETAFLVENSYVEIQDGIAYIFNGFREQKVFYFRSVFTGERSRKTVNLIFEIPDEYDSFFIGGDKLKDYNTYIFYEGVIYRFDQFEPVNQGTISGYLCEGVWYVDANIEVDVIHENIDLLSYKFINQLEIPEVPN